jgi:Zn ribbon nucleic-acid-binding protein
MSRQHQTDLECPKCNSQVTITLWSSLNVTDDPELKDALLNGEINLFQCIQCSHEAYVAIPFLYHDMRNQFCVQYFPFESMNDKNFFDNFMPDGKLFMNLSGQKIESMSYLEDTHIVFSMHELVQYVIFRDRLREAKKQSMRSN